MELFVARQEGKIASAPQRHDALVKKVDEVWCKDLRAELRDMGG